QTPDDHADGHQEPPPAAIREPSKHRRQQQVREHEGCVERAHLAFDGPIDALAVGVARIFFFGKEGLLDAGLDRRQHLAIEVAEKVDTEEKNQGYPRAPTWSNVAGRGSYLGHSRTPFRGVAAIGTGHCTNPYRSPASG